MKALQRAGKWRHCLDLLATMEARGVGPDRVSFNVALEALDAHGQGGEAMRLMARARERGLFDKAWASEHTVS